MKTIDIKKQVISIYESAINGNKEEAKAKLEKLVNGLDVMIDFEKIF